MVAKSKMYLLFSFSIPIHSSRPEEDALALKTVCQKENKVVKSTVVQIISSSSGKPEETTSISLSDLRIESKSPVKNAKITKGSKTYQRL